MRQAEQRDMIVTSLLWAGWGMIAAAALHLAGAPWWVVAYIAIVGFAPMLGSALHLMGE